MIDESTKDHQYFHIKMYNNKWIWYELFQYSIDNNG